MKTAYVFLAEGFEETEAITPIDVMLRAGIKVVSVGIGGRLVKSSHGVMLQADMDDRNFTLPADADLVMLPGGGLGTQNLKKSDTVAKALAEAAKRDIYITAICAGPTVLDQAGLLNGKRVTAFPSEQASLTRSQVTGGAVEVDGKIITGRSMGVSLEFGRAIAEALVGKEKTDEAFQKLYP